MINFPTREDNILDLICTNNPVLFNNIEQLPPIGKSDHITIRAELNVSIKQSRITKRKTAT